MTFTSIFSVADDNIISVHPHHTGIVITVYQDFNGDCKKIKIEDLNGEEEIEEAIFLDDGKKFY
tara:strand:+ start:874 stop:1065 length:192 start_codon:yes stop_codon:yes gene_type:complete